MRKWLRDRPWFWLVLLLGFLVAGGLVMVGIAERNRPYVVKDEAAASATAVPATELPNA